MYKHLRFALALRPRFEPGSVAREDLLFREEASPRKQSLIWIEVKADLLKYLESMAYNERTAEKIVAQLDKQQRSIRDTQNTCRNSQVSMQIWRYQAVQKTQTAFQGKRNGFDEIVFTEYEYLA